MSNLTNLERKQLIVGLKALYAQNLDFISSDKFKKRNAELYDYITQIENGADCTRTLREWCNLFGDILVGGNM